MVGRSRSMLLKVLALALAGAVEVGDVLVGGLEDDAVDEEDAASGYDEEEDDDEYDWD